MSDDDRLRKAWHYRDIARSVSDPELADELNRLASELVRDGDPPSDLDRD